MGKLSALGTETTFSLSDFLVKVKAAGAGDQLITLQNFINAIGAAPSNPYKFSVYLAADQAISASTFTKVTLNTKNFDTGTNFDATTNFRFTVPVSGFYMIYAQTALSVAGFAAGYGESALYKNGSQYITSDRKKNTGDANTIPRPVVGGLLQLTAGDYLEVYGWLGEAGRAIAGGAGLTYMTGHLVSVS